MIMKKNNNCNITTRTRKRRRRVIWAFVCQRTSWPKMVSIFNGSVSFGERMVFLTSRKIREISANNCKVGRTYLTTELAFHCFVRGSISLSQLCSEEVLRLSNQIFSSYHQIRRLIYEFFKGYCHSRGGAGGILFGL